MKRPKQPDNNHIVSWKDYAYELEKYATQLKHELDAVYKEIGIREK